MKNTKSLIAALVFAGASLGSSAVLADDISSAPQALTLLDGSAYFGDAFGLNNSGDTFADHFTFSVAGEPHYLDAIISSIAGSAATGLDITGLGLYTSVGALVTAGTMSSTGVMDVWSISSDGLAVGDYYLQVSGSLVSNTSGSFGGAIMLVPVPEPETYGMLLAGLGVLGFLARRRKELPE
jgi:hypothetical protein